MTATRFVTHLMLALSMASAAPALGQTVDSIAPTQLVRGRETEVIVRGTDLDRVTAAALSGTGLSIVGFAVDSAEQLHFRVGVGDRTALGERDVTLVADTPVVVDGALTVAAGPPDLLTLAPEAVSRGQTVTLILTGRNLDTVTTASLGAGITITDFTATSPVNATAQATVGAAAFAGARDLVLTGSAGTTTYPAALVVDGGEVVVSRVVPASGTRGQTLEVTIEGENLDAATGARFGTRTLVEDFAVISPTEATATLTLGEDATAGVRDVSVLFGDASVLAPGRFTVLPGASRIDRIRPDRVQQSVETTLIIEGLNLDGVTNIDLGPGVETLALNATFPTSIEVDISVADDAPLGLRDLVVTGPNGSAELELAFGVTEFVLPDPDILFADRTAIGPAQVGARVAGGFQLENVGLIDELVTIGPAIGDADLFFLLDPDTGRGTTALTRTLAIGELATIDVLFEPSRRGNYGVAWPIYVRDGVELGRIIVEGSATAPQLVLSLTSPTDFGVLDAARTTPLPRLDTLLAEGVLPRSRLLTGVELRVWRDGTELDSDALPIAFEIQSTVSGDVLYWGTTEIVWSFAGPAGSYEGELALTSDDERAPLIPFEFTFEVAGQGGQDTGADVGPDAEADAGDTGLDTGDADAGSGSDGGSDAGPDAGPDSDTAADASADSGADAGPDPDDGGGAGGGCTSSRRSASPWALAALGVLVWRRRRS